ncbi:DUF4091 domain-containing protein [Candidatus Poribacteria bacterium]|nr:DUF4091 domain-containing protein [Candidatus Poribacteria bacterium]
MIGEIILLVLVTIVVTAIGIKMTSADTVILQQGANGYTGCITETLWGNVVAEVDDQRYLYLRGARNHCWIRFEIPDNLACKPLARAQLCLFLPEARNPNIFTEIFCHEVTAGGRLFIINKQTDYDNGRRAGAVDSVELFAPPGPNWKHFPYLPLSVPEGGRWIEFNITPLVEKWLKDPTTNHGVMLIPTDCPDERFPSTWEIDIPSASFDGPPLWSPVHGGHLEHRPKLILEFAPLQQEYLVGITNSLRRICDRSTRYRYRGDYRSEYKMSMAKNEFEGFQVVIYPLRGVARRNDEAKQSEELKNVYFTWTNLTNDAGDKIPSSDIEYFIEDWYQLRRNWKTRDVFFGGKLYETVDPLIPSKPITIKRHTHTPFFFRVRTRLQTQAGTYRGTITVQADNINPVQFSLEVKVWPYAIPEKWNFHTMGQLVWENLRRFHGDDFNDELVQQYYDFLLEHRFSPTEQYISHLSPRMKLDACLKRGMNTIYLSGNFTGSFAELESLKESYETIKKLGALDYALIYIGDETDNWDEMRRRANLVHAHLPGVMVMIGGSLPNEELMDYIDIYDPLIGGQSKIYSLQEQYIHLINQAQQRGEEFYWYVACGPSYPYPNVQVEYPLIAARVLFWMTRKYGVTGFEYYCYNIWEQNYSPDPAKRYPNVKWNADGWSRGWPTNADGMLFYPGPITSLRLEAIRDGIEDWESHLVLRDYVEAVKNRKDASKYSELIDQAERLLKVDDEIVTDFTHYTMDPERLLTEREAMGDLIAQFVEIVSRTDKWDAGAYTYDKAVEVRIARQNALRRKMLHARHLKASWVLRVKPISQEDWDALWPKRILFKQNFEGTGDWDGQIVTDNVTAGNQRALAGHAENQYFARFIRVGIRVVCLGLGNAVAASSVFCALDSSRPPFNRSVGEHNAQTDEHKANEYDHARAATTTWINFQYYINQNVPLEVMLFDLTQNDNYAGRITKPVVGKWTEVMLKVTDEFQRKDGSSASMAPGDAIDDIFFGAGSPGDQDLQLIVKNVVLLGLD